ncbi:MAG: D-glycero-beta-D-manno-heptose-7-phosphate kinase [Rhodospirillales bacterium]|nr:D-glycero-beta-D-manno-heptose-7-phosphate kinase [Rhodospirillales bacterium]
MADGTLPGLLPRFADGRVLVLGDIMLDRYVQGEVRRISPEAPIPVLKAEARRAVLGGAANVAQNVAALGAGAVLVGVVGMDDAATEIGRLLAASPAITACLVPVPQRPTTVKTRFVSGGHQLLRLDEEESGAIAPAQEAQILAEFELALAQADVVVLSDYAKGVLTDRVLAGAIAAARAAGKLVIADPKRASFAAYRGVDVLTPNEAEAARASGLATDDDDGAVRAGEAALAQAAAGAVLVTRSAKGLTLVRRDAPPLHVPTRARAVADVSGAGDTLVAAFAIGLACGADMPVAAMLANVAAGISVGKPGTATVSHGELGAALHRRELLALEDKIAETDAAGATVAAWRAQGLRVGFTNGCFDLVHPGHVRLLARARAACDRLVVGLNSDASVKRLKGEGRPVQNEMARATVMASIGAVDLVVLFEQDTPEALIGALLPDLLFKGADYRIDEVVGGDIVRAHGGEVRLIDLEAGHSTTATIRRIHQRAG